ncbi:MAG: DNA polymerase III subunit alpha [Myxococcota bacterium]
MMLLSFQSSFSPFEGLYSPEEIYNIAKGLGYSSVLIADTNNLYGFAEIIRLRREKGLNIYTGSLLKYSTKDSIPPILAIPIDDTGLSNLFNLISSLNTNKNLRDEKFMRYLTTLSDGLILISSDINTIKTLKKLSQESFFGINHKNIPLYPLVKAEGIRAVILQNAILHSEEDITTAILLRCIERRKRFDEMSHIYESLKCHIAIPFQSMEKRFRYIYEAFENLNYIESRLQDNILKPAEILPGKELLDAPSRLYKLAINGAKKRYTSLNETILSRLRYELNIISQKGYAGYFLIVKEIIDRTELTCGRGSAAASLVAYCLGITNVDPIKHNLMFERFLNPERSDPPDIDVDFAWDEREEIFDFIFNKYNQRAAQVSNHNRFAKRLAIREVARALGFSEEEIKRITRILEPLMDYKHQGRYIHKEERGVIRDSTINKIYNIASRIAPNMRHISTHCGGVVISQRDIKVSLPLEITGGGRLVTQWDKDDLEELSIVKIDILGNRSLAVIRDARKMIQRNYGIDIKKKRVSFEEDALTIELLRRGKTIGVFYIESPAMRQIQKKTGVADFEHIVIHSSIIRPAANRYINEYIERLKGKPYRPLHPALSELLSETYGIMCYQEDVMKAAISIAGFNYEDADRLRKTLSKKNRAERIEYYREKFFEGGRKRGVDEVALREIWEMIESFGGYSFCKPHSASYAQVSFMSAYIKAHFPAEFIASVIGNKGGYYSVFAYISEARRMGIRVNPPDINLSDKKAVAIGDSIWLGFEDILGLKQSAIERIITEREREGKYTDFRDFIRRNGELDFEDIRLITLSGSFDKMEGIQNRTTLMLRAELFKKGKSGTLFPNDTTKTVNLPPLSFKRIIEIESEIFGFPLSIHPIKLAPQLPPATHLIKASEMGKYIGKEINILAILITAKPILTSQDEPMEFLTFEDETDIFEAVLFPSAYRNFSHIIDTRNAFILSGKVEEDHGAIYLNCNRVKSVKLSTENLQIQRTKSTA